MTVVRSIMLSLAVCASAYAEDVAIDVCRTDPAIAAILMDRGEALMKTGDISGARLALSPAVDCGISRAERAYAQTFDINWLNEHHATNAKTLGNAYVALLLYRDAAKQGDQVAKSYVTAIDAIPKQEATTCEK